MTDGLKGSGDALRLCEVLARIAEEDACDCPSPPYLACWKLAACARQFILLVINNRYV